MNTYYNILFTLLHAIVACLAFLVLLNTKRILKSIWVQLRSISPKIQSKINFIVYIAINLVLSFYILNNEYSSYYAIILIAIGHVRDSLFSIVYYPLSFFCVKHRKETTFHNRATICSIVPCYSETAIEVYDTMCSILNQSQVEGSAIFLVVDGNTSLCTEILEKVDIAKSFELKFKSWKGVDVKSMIYLGSTKESNKPIVILDKMKNTGKKCSLIISEQLLATNIEIQTFLDENFGICKFDYIFHTDADTILDPNCIERLIVECDSRNADACCGFVKVDFQNSNRVFNFWNNLQYCQYFSNQLLRRRMESITQSVLCMPGCVSLIKLKNRETLYQTVLSDYSKVSNKFDNIYRLASVNQGTDRNYTKQVLKNGGKIVMCENAIGLTKTPQNLRAFISQRRRWTSNAYTNAFTLVASSRTSIMTKVIALINILRICITPFRALNAVVFISNMANITVDQIIVLSVFVVPSLLYLLLHYIFYEKQYKTQLLIGFILNKVFTPLFSTVIVSNMFLHIFDFSWNKNTDEDEKIEVNEEEEVEVEVEVEVNEEEKVEVEVNEEEKVEVEVNEEEEDEEKVEVE